MGSSMTLPDIRFSRETKRCVALNLPIEASSFRTAWAGDSTAGNVFMAFRSVFSRILVAYGFLSWPSLTATLNLEKDQRASLIQEAAAKKIKKYIFDIFIDTRNADC